MARMTNRITTREAAEIAGQRPAEMLRLLKAAGLQPTRCAGAYLWDVEEVRALLRALASVSANEPGRRS